MSHEEFWAFVQRPTLRCFRAWRRLVSDSGHYDPQALALHQLQQWCLADDWLTARLGALAIFAEYQTSPRFHFLMGQAEEGLGDTDGVQRCRAAFQSCLRMLLATGQGDSERPFQPLWVTDVNDVAMALGLDIRCRRTLQRGRRTLDVVTAHDGRELWFDATVMTRQVPWVARQRVASQV
ncbi:MAG: hypothetical protein U0795_11005 [Pirellulales bacterium]